MRTPAAALALAALLASPARGEFSESLVVDPGGTLEIDIDLGEGLRPDPGDLRIRSHDRDEVR
ncbi:MAG: hypothetical protein ABFS46_11665, partial [Myxococcota bacterium]